VRYPDEPWHAAMDTESRSGCSRAELVLEYTALAAEAGNDYRVCVVAKDDSAMCAGIAPSASERGWYGETHCIIFQVVQPVLEWLPETLALFTGEVDLIVGCESRLLIAARDVSVSVVTGNVSHPTGNYHVGLYPLASVELPEGTQLSAQPGATHACKARTGPCAAARELTWRPKRGAEGRRFQVCFGVRDEFAVTSLGLSCKGGVRHGLPCHGDSQCPGVPGEAPGKPGGAAGSCSVADSCVTLHVVRCRYCAEGQDSLAKTAREYGLEMNWLRMWALNGNFNGDASFSNAVIRNPDLIQTGTHQQHLLVGVTYAVKQGETVLSVAARFRTTAKSILSLNFDLASSVESDPTMALPADQHLCVIPCSNFAFEA